jgi:hypothetical protein
MIANKCGDGWKCEKCPEGGVCVTSSGYGICEFANCVEPKEDGTAFVECTFRREGW